MLPIFQISATDLEEISSKNVILYNLTDDLLLYEKSSDEKVLIASMTKIMTAIVAIENIENLDEKVVLTENIFNDLGNDLSMAGFKPNEIVTYRDLLYGALLPSGADATHSLAVLISGNEESFVNLMNEKAQNLKLKDTHFTNTIGIETNDNMHYSTVKDVATLLKYSLKNKEFKKIFSSLKYKTSNNLHEFESTRLKIEEKNNLDLSIIKGSKTGYTSHAGLCLASIASFNKIDYLLITAGADYKTSKINHFLDAQKIYNYFYNNYSYKTIKEKNSKIAEIKTIYNEKVDIYLNEDITLYLKNDIKASDLKYLYKGQKVLNKNVKKGDFIGKYLIMKDDKILAEQKVFSPINVHFRIKNMKLFIVSIILLILLTIIFFKRIKKLKNRKIY